MARQGITLAQVTTAAAELTAKGEIVTSRAVRDLLGTGSLTTIQSHLKDWRSNAADQAPVVRQLLPLPPAALEPLAAAFAEAQRVAMAPLENELAAVKQERDDSVEISKELAADLEQAEQDRDQAQAAVSQLQGRLSEHEQIVATLDRERTARTAAEQRSAAAEARIEQQAITQKELKDSAAELAAAQLSAVKKLEAELVTTKQAQAVERAEAAEQNKQSMDAASGRAAAEAQVKQLQGRVAELGQTVEALNAERNAKAAAEQRAIAAEAKIEHLSAAAAETTKLRAQLQAALSQVAVLQAQQPQLKQLEQKSGVDKSNVDNFSLTKSD